MPPLDTINPVSGSWRETIIRKATSDDTQGRVEAHMEYLFNEVARLPQYFTARARMHMLIALHCTDMLSRDQFGDSPPSPLQHALALLDALAEQPYDRHAREDYRKHVRISCNESTVGSAAMSRVLRLGVLSHQSLTVRSALVVTLSQERMRTVRENRNLILNRREDVTLHVREQIRNILADLFCIPAVHPPDESFLQWNNGCIRGLAEQMYGDDDFSHMPILADALEEAGCENTEILNHCRADVPHRRGCAVVDVLLGKR